jgi:hypothetical protein
MIFILSIPVLDLASYNTANCIWLKFRVRSHVQFQVMNKEKKILVQNICMDVIVCLVMFHALPWMRKHRSIIARWFILRSMTLINWFTELNQTYLRVALSLQNQNCT